MVGEEGKLREKAKGFRLWVLGISNPKSMNFKDHERLFEALARSKFRSRFRMQGKELAYLGEKGLDEVMRHAQEFLARRLFPALIPNDGKQTPMRGHPVFIAQHATATCCRSCLARWHGIAPGHALDPKEQEYVLGVIRAWLEKGKRL